MSDFSEPMDVLSAEKRELLELLLQDTDNETPLFPLSFAQQRLWFLDQLAPNSALYNIPAVVRLSGQLDTTVLEHNLNAIVARHEVLRTTFPVVEGQPVQKIAPVLTLQVPVIDLRAHHPGEHDALVQQLATAEAQKPFDLDRGPLLRVTLLKLAEHEHVLLLTLHHIIADGWSIGVFVRELAALYAATLAGRPDPLPELPIQYADFAEWQRQELTGEILDAQLSYWKQQLGRVPCPEGTRHGTPAPTILDLPTDRPRPPVQSYSGARQSLLLPQALYEQIKTLSYREQATPFMVLLAAFNILLYRYTSQTSILVGSPIANRNQDEIEGLIGCFVNTLVLRTELGGDPSFRELLQRVRTTTLEAYDHQDLPFEKIVEELQPERDASRAALFQVLFVMQNTPMPKLEAPGLTLSLLDVDTGTAKFDLTLTLEEAADGLRATISYNTDLFDATTITRLLSHFHTLVAGCIAEPEQRITGLPLLTPAERQELLVTWNATADPTFEPCCIQHLFEAQAARTPNAAAVVFEDQELTYAELNRRANQLAHHLRGLGVGPETRVGICVERSLEMMIGLLGILKAGGAYVPLDPAYPQERLQFMVADAQIGLLLTQAQLAATPALSQGTVLCLDQHWATIAQEADDNPGVVARPDNLAYVIYTSGSTGQPKGVTVSHRAVSNHLHWRQQSYPLAAGDRFLQKTSLSFDISVWECFAPLLAGAQLILARPGGQYDPAYLARLITEREITVMHSGPAFLQVLLAEPQFAACRSLQRIFCGGESLTGELQARCFATLEAELYHQYGPTEACIDATIWNCRRDDTSARIPIGYPIANTTCYILDRAMQPVPVGVPGELYIGGTGLARGYLNRPDLTADKFVPDPFSTESSARLYKTGDLARYLPNGAIEFVGRIDDQVKLRGFRIELGEIESVLRQHPQIREVLVMARADSGEQRLVAYVVGKEQKNKEQRNKGQNQNLPSPAATKAEVRLSAGQGKAGSPLGDAGGDGLTSELRRFLGDKLPDYMIPSAFVLLAELPLTHNGKVDRKALPAPDTSDSAAMEVFVAPRTPTEELIAGIWAATLKQPRIGVHDNFFALGGHSLLITQVSVELRKVFQVDLPLRALFEAPTVASLAQRLEQQRGSASPPIRQVARDQDLPLSFSQERIWFLHQLDPTSAAYHLPYFIRLRGTLDVGALEQSLAAIIARHEVLRTVFPSRAGRPVQVIMPAQPVTLPVIDLRAWPETEQEAETVRLIDTAAAAPFDLAQGPLLRGTIVRLAEDEHLLLLTLHHIVSDAWSRTVLARELAAFYTAYSGTTAGDDDPLLGLPSPLPELPVQYADYASWQRQWLAPEAPDEVLATQLAYWQRQLAELPALELPTDRPRPIIQTFRGATHTATLPAEMVAALKALSCREGVTLFMTLLTAFQTLLYRYSGQRDFGVGSPIANRDRAEVQGLVGLFLNMLVLRADLTGRPSFRELLGRVRSTALEAYAHQDLPFEKLVEELQLERDLSRSPLFQVMFALQHSPAQTSRLANLDLSPLPAATDTAKFDLTLSIIDTDADAQISWEYNVDLFDAATIARLSGHFQTLLVGMIANPDQQLAEMPLLSVEEQQQMLGLWNATGADYPATACIQDLFEAQAARTPDAIAVLFRDQHLTYHELDRRANQLANHLWHMGVTNEMLVGVYIDRSIEMLVALLAVLKAGGAYLPLDPNYPADRLQYMLADAQVGVLVTAQHLLPQMPQHSAAVVCIDRDWSTIEQAGDGSPRIGISSQNLAYVLYTSGSTGRPKGVMVSHRNVVNFFTGMDRSIGADPGTWLALTSISFDISVLELLWTLTRGFEVVIQAEQDHGYAAATTTAAGTDRGMDFSLFYFSSDEFQSATDKYRLLVEGAKFADQHGFTAVWTPERHFHEFGGLYPNPAVVSAALAMVTERIQLRAGSVVLPLQNPLRVAEEWAVVDNLSRGRVGLSFASGWNANDFVLVPANYHDRKQIMLRDIETVRKLWRGEATTLTNGVDKPVAIATHPRPIQPDLPVWITASNSPETFQMAGEAGAGLLTHLLGQSVEDLKAKIARYRQAWRAHGHPGEGHVTLMLHTFVGDDLEAVRQKVRRPFLDYLRSSLDLWKNLAQSFGRDLDAEAFSDEEEAALLDHAFDRYAETSSLMGTPETCLRMVNRLKAIGVNEIGCLIDFGVDVESVLASLEYLDSVKIASNRVVEVDPTDYSLPAQIVRRRVTHLQCTPSMANMLLQEPATQSALQSLRTLLLGGEALPVGLAQQLTSLLPAALYNMYGPTETTIWSGVQPITQVDSCAPIGGPIANTQIYILDPVLQPVPVGVPGEIYIGGAGVVRGYWQRPDVTAERFLPDPFSAETGNRLYRTGDRGRYLPGGSIEFLGRLDQQIKLGGYRIELGEIEAVLSQHPDVQEAVVVVREDQPGEKYLAGYAVPAAGLRVALQPKLSPAEQMQLFAGRKRYTLPNDMLIAHLSDLQATAGYREVVEDEIYLRHGITLNDGDVIFDVGANIGFFTLFANQKRRGLKIYAFEPIPPTFEVLKTNVTLYGLDVELFNCGLSRRAETVEFTFYPEMAGLSGRYSEATLDRRATKAIILNDLHNTVVNPQGLTLSEADLDEILDRQFRSERHLCTLRTLSDVVREHNVQQIDLLKVDVERAEVDVLAGIQDDDWARIKQIVLEVDTQENLEQIQDLLAQRGFNVIADDFVVVPGGANDPGVWVYMVYASRQPLSQQPEAAPRALSSGELRKHLKERLPEYMVPTVLTLLPTLPRTPNGKLDRKALPIPTSFRPELEVAYSAPQTEVEQVIAQVWQAVLRVERVGVHDNFFELGGTSLLIVQARTQLREALGYDVSLVDMFRYPTVSTLAEYLSQAKAAPASFDKARDRAEKQMARRQGRATRGQRNHE